MVRRADAAEGDSPSPCPGQLYELHGWAKLKSSVSGRSRPTICLAYLCHLWLACHADCLPDGCCLHAKNIIATLIPSSIHSLLIPSLWGMRRHLMQLLDHAECPHTSGPCPGWAPLFVRSLYCECSRHGSRILCYVVAFFVSCRLVRWRLHSHLCCFESIFFVEFMR